MMEKFQVYLERKMQVKEVKNGLECGISIKRFYRF
jgi:hypothetical protein